MYNEYVKNKIDLEESFLEQKEEELIANTDTYSLYEILNEYLDFKYLENRAKANLVLKLNSRCYTEIDRALSTFLLDNVHDLKKIMNEAVSWYAQKELKVAKLDNDVERF